MKIYENANDQHVRKVVLYGVGNAIAFDPEGTELLTKEQIVDAFLKGCVVENEGNYKTPTGVNVTDSGAELVFGGGSGGPEVENAIETGGLGWTESEPKEGFDITWDGNAEGLDVVEEQFFKVANNISGVASGADLLGATMIVSPDEGNLEMTEDIIETITEDKLITTDNKVYGLMSSLGASAVFIALEDGTIEGMNFTKGVWFIGVEETLHVSRLYKEASTEEVVHQIDEKYIPQGSFVIDYSDPKSDDYEKAIEFFDANRPVYLSKDSSKIPMTGYNSTHCFFGGTVSAYLPGGYVICVYAHIGPEGTNYFWYQYNSPVEVPASAMVVTFTSDDDGNLISDKTVSEVKEALGSTNVSGVVQYPGADLFATLQTLFDDNGFILAFGVYQKAADQNAYFFIPQIKEEDGEWVTIGG